MKKKTCNNVIDSRNTGYINSQKAKITQTFMNGSYAIIHIIKYSAKEKNEVLIHDILMNLKNIMLSKISQKRKAMFYMTVFI